MMTEYSDADILKDIENYIKGGMRILAYEPQYLPEVREFIGDDAERLEKLMNQNGHRTFLLEMREYVDIANCGRNVRAFQDDKLLAAAEKVFGAETEEILSKLNICWEEDGKIKYGRDMHLLGKDARSGLCRSFYPDNHTNNVSAILVGTNNMMPEEELWTFYHECGHALQKNLCEYANQDFQMVWQFQNSGMKFGTNGELRRKYDEAAGYLCYFKEAHAETFAMTTLMLKARGEDEFQFFKSKSLKRACRKQLSGVGKRKNAWYNCYPSVTAVCRHLDKLGAEGRKKFLDAEGKVDFLKINAYTAKAVNSTMYGKKEFFDYSAGKGEENARWRRDCREAEVLKKQFPPMNFWSAFFTILRDIKRPEDAYRFIARRGGRNPAADAEKKRLAALFLKHNPLVPAEAKYYAKKDLGR